MALLAHHVPLTLLLDLVEPTGPDSVAICSTERPARDPIWVEAAGPVQQRRRRAG
jgi:hypothetical protein